MGDLFGEDDLVEADPFVSSEEEVDVDLTENSTLNARRRLEKMLEEKELERRLRDELDDFVDD